MTADADCDRCGGTGRWDRWVCECVHADPTTDDTQGGEPVVTRYRDGTETVEPPTDTQAPDSGGDGVVLEWEAKGFRARLEGDTVRFDADLGALRNGYRWGYVQMPGLRDYIATLRRERDEARKGGEAFDRLVASLRESVENGNGDVLPSEILEEALRDG